MSFHDHLHYYKLFGCLPNQFSDSRPYVCLFVSLFVCLFLSRKLLKVQTAFTSLLSFFIACKDNNPDCAGYIYENGGPEEYCNDPEPYIQEYVKEHCRKTCNIDNCKWSIAVIISN